MLIILSTIGTAITAATTASLADTARDFLDGRISSNEFTDEANPVLAIQSLLGIVSLAAGVITIIWMYRVASNVRAYQRRTTFHPLFAIFGWVLPPVVYVIPLLMLRELWKASNPDPAVNHQPDGWKATPDNQMLWVWFLLYSIVPAVLAVLQARFLFDQIGLGGDTDAVAETLDQNTVFVWLGAVVTVGAAFAWIKFTKALTERHVLLTGER